MRRRSDLAARAAPTPAGGARTAARAGARVVALAAALAAAPAAADWTARDMGRTFRESDCVEAAARALETHALTFGGDRVARASWMVIGDGLGVERLDAAILCTNGPGGRTVGTLVIHADATPVARLVTADSISRLWRDIAGDLDEAYLRDARSEAGR